MARRSVAVIPARAGRCPDVAELVAMGREQGLDAVGVAPATPFDSTMRHLQERKARGLHGGMNFTYRSPERSTDPQRALPGAQALVVGARSYMRGPGTRDTNSAAVSGAPMGTVARYARDDHYAVLRRVLTALAGHLRARGWRTRVLVDDNALVDREAAYRAGLGWYGKNSNLLLAGAGSWFVLGSVLTDAPLATDDGPRVPDGCGGCTRCLAGCPTGAIVAPGVVDARRCLAWLLQVDGAFPREYRVALGNRIYGCDDCQEVCPPNRHAERTVLPNASGEREASTDAQVDLLEMLARRDDELLERFGRWYIPRRQPRYLRRNALVVLGNVADPGDEGVVAALRRALADDDPLIRAHAVWAARRLGRDDLVEVAGLAEDPDPLVREELTAPLELASWAAR